MKPTRMKVIKMPMPVTRAEKAGRAALAASSFAHHPPSQREEPARMRRPRGGGGPRNPEA